MKKTMLVLGLMIVGALAAYGDAPDPMLRQLDFLAGSWRCSGTAFASPDSPQHATMGEVTGKWGLDGHWLPFEYAEKKTAANGNPMRVSGYFGYDAERKVLVLGSVDNTGGYTTADSNGWNGDSIAFTGPWHTGGGTVNGRDPFRKSGSALMHVFEIEQNGAMVKVAEEKCTRK